VGSTGASSGVSVTIMHEWDVCIRMMPIIWTWDDMLCDMNGGTWSSVRWRITRFGRNTTLIRLQVSNSNPAILAPQLLWLSTVVTIRLTSPRRLIPACETKNTSKNSKETQHSNWSDNCSWMIKLESWGSTNRKTATVQRQIDLKQNPNPNEGSGYWDIGNRGMASPWTRP
jgi:hypothetical protein